VGRNLRTTGIAALAALALLGVIAVASPAVALANDIPSAIAVPLPIVNATGPLDAVNATEAVYAVQLNAGQTIAIGLAGTAGTDYDLGLFSPDATSVTDIAHLSAASLKGGTSAESMMFLAPASGTYFVDVSARPSSAPGTYTLNARLDIYTPSKPTGPSRIKHRKNFTMLTYLTPSYANLKAKPVTFVLYRKEHGVWVNRLRGKATLVSHTKTRAAYGVNAWLSSGKWMVKAYFTDSLHSRTYSLPRYISVY